jgi:hypothetical protein
MKQPYNIDQAIIHMISGLPTFDKYPTTSLVEKDAQQEKVYFKYGTRGGKCGVVIPKIKNSVVRFATQLLACKPFCKFWKDECTIGVILTIEHYDDGIQMSWAPYLFKEFLTNCLIAHDEGK